MLQSPHDSYRAVGRPATAEKSNETRSKITLISKLLGERSDGPPDQKGIEKIEKPTGERVAQKEERKNQHKARGGLS
jgi:hypothetical protein